MSQFQVKILASPDLNFDEYLKSDDYDTAEEAYFTLKSLLRDGLIASQPNVPPPIDGNQAIQPPIAVNTPVLAITRHGHRLKKFVYSSCSVYII